MAKKKTWNEKLQDSKDLPKVVKLKGGMAKRYGKGMIVIPAPLDVDARMKQVRKGKLTTIDVIRDSIANEHSVEVT